MNYGETLDYLFSQLPMYQRIGAAAYKTDLFNTRKLLEIQDHPEKRFRSIHIAGTNGKGSVAHMLASVLQSQGYKTGLYTSPHLKDFRERIRINGLMIPEESVIRYVDKYHNAFEIIKASFFEMTVGMAFEYFADEAVDIAVIETGLGGRLDSTNVIEPELSIITNIGHDHMRFLGNDLPSIAKEKAGIIKKNVPVIIGRAEGEVLEVFKARAKEQNAELVLASDFAQIQSLQHIDGPKSQLLLDVDFIDGTKLEQLRCPLTGSYQIENVLSVLTALCFLPEYLFVDEQAIHNGIKNVKENTSFFGRWEILSQTPYIVADTAHNPEGIKAVLEQWMAMNFKDRHIVLGFVDDKNLKEILRLFPSEARYYFCQPDIIRAYDVGLLAAMAENAGLSGQAYPSVMEALSSARMNVSTGGSIYIGGSTFVVAEIPQETYF